MAINGSDVSKKVAILHPELHDGGSGTGMSHESTLSCCLESEQKLLNSTHILEAISKAQSQFIANVDTKVLFDDLLADLLSLTQSEYGFIGEVLHDPDGKPYLKSHAITNIAWNDETRAFYEKHAATGLEFRNLKSLFGAVLTTGKEVISNSPSIDPRRCGIPEGHPALSSFLGLPFYNAGQMIGMIGIANRPGGYDQRLVSFLEPFTATCANIIAAHNIDRRRRDAEEALRKSSERLKGAQSISRLGNWDWDIATGELAWSDEIFRIFGLDPQVRPQYETFLETIHPDDRQAVIAAVDDAVKGKKPYSIDHRIILPNGEVRVVHEQGEVKVSDGVPVSMAGTVQDITSQKLMEECLMESERKYRTLFEDSMDVIFITDSDDGRILDINPAGVELLGCESREDALKRTITEFYNCPDERERFKEAVLKYGFVKDYEVFLKRADGAGVLASITATVVKGENGKSTFQGILRDMTEHARLQQQLLHAHKMEAVGQLTGGIAHDFNNILTAVMGYANILSIKMKEGDPNRKYAENILSLAEKGANLTSGLLSFSRKDIVAIAPVALNRLINDLSGLLMKLLRVNIEFRLTLCPEELVVMADRGQIEQVLMNLATNARDAMPGGGLLTVSTGKAQFDDDFAVKSSGYGSAGKFAFITFSDTGCGMDEATRKRIFEPFFTTKTIGEGTGLGLSIVYGIINQHGGDIKVYSEPGFGTTFKVFIPLAESAVEAVSADRGEEASLRGTETILVAEDDPDVNIITKTLLEEFGYKVIITGDGAEAVEAFRAEKDNIDLVILDVIMPNKNGREAYEEIRGMSADVRVIFTSGYTEDIINSKMIFEHGLDFISKPLAASLLLKKVREVLDSGK